MNNQFDKEMEYLEDDLANGIITNEEFYKLRRQMESDYANEAECAAQDAYEDEMKNWYY